MRSRFTIPAEVTLFRHIEPTAKYPQVNISLWFFPYGQDDAEVITSRGLFVIFVNRLSGIANKKHTAFAVFFLLPEPVGIQPRFRVRSKPMKTSFKGSSGCSSKCGVKTNFLAFLFIPVYTVNK